MTQAKFHLQRALAMLLLAASGAAVVFAQPPNFAPPASLTVQPPRQDAFDNLITSAASFDMESPVTARAEFDPPVAVSGQRVVYRLEVSALEESLKIPNELPAPADFPLRAGGHAQVYQHTGGVKLQPVTTFLFHGVALSNGTFTVPAFDLLAYGKPIKVAAASLTVVPAGAAPVRQPPSLLLEVPPGDIYVGQLLRLQLLLPDAGDGRVLGFNRSRVTGEFVFPESSALGLRREIIQRNGRSVPAFIEDSLLTPLREGRQEIIAQAYALLIRPMPGHSNVMQPYLALIDSDPVTLRVKGLPAEGKLPGFSGAIGNFQLDPPRLATNDLLAGEPFTLNVTLRGDGNIGRLKPPRLPDLKEWQAFPPAPESLPPMSIQQRGSVNFAYTFIPLSDQITATPAIPFSYFDPVKKMYVDLTIPPVPIKVTGTAGQTNAFISGMDGSAAAEPELVLAGLLPESNRVVARLVPLQQRGWFLALQFVPAFFLGGLWFWDSRRRYRQQHPEVVLKRRARRGVRRQLRLARRAAAVGDVESYTVRAANALREVSAPHAAANPDALVCADVLRELPESDQSGRHGEIVRRLFAADDALRFGGPASSIRDLLALQPDVERLLEKMKERL